VVNVNKNKKKVKNWLAYIIQSCLTSAFPLASTKGTVWKRFCFITYVGWRMGCLLCVSFVDSIVMSDGNKRVTAGIISMYEASKSSITIINYNYLSYKFLCYLVRISFN